MRAARAAAAALAGLTLLWAGGPACLVDSHCQADYDCAAGERCNREGRCFVECARDQDCYQNGAYIGKQCVANRCEFRFDERVAAPNFCLKVMNPKSALAGKDFCLASAKGKVVALYFGWLT